MNDRTRGSMKVRHELGSWMGYLGLLTGLMVLLATTSEGTPFAPQEKAWVVFGFMLAGYLLGWLVAPVVDRLARLE